MTSFLKETIVFLSSVTVAQSETVSFSSVISPNSFFSESNVLHLSQLIIPSMNLVISDDINRHFLRMTFRGETHRARYSTPERFGELNFPGKHQ
jgi:hypothetical protein